MTLNHARKIARAASGNKRAIRECLKHGCTIHPNIGAIDGSVEFPRKLLKGNPRAISRHFEIEYCHSFDPKQKIKIATT